METENNLLNKMGKAHCAKCPLANNCKLINNRHGVKAYCCNSYREGTEDVIVKGTPCENCEFRSRCSLAYVAWDIKKVGCRIIRDLVKSPAKMFVQRDPMMDFVEITSVPLPYYPN